MIRIVVPIGGEGKRFAEKGHTFPKPLIEIAGRPMIDIVVQNLMPRESHQFVFICRKEHMDKYALDNVLKLVAPGCEIVSMSKPTGGALCSILLGMGHMKENSELVIANSDQFVDVSIDNFLEDARKKKVDGSIMTFPSTHPKWSFARVNDAGEVIGVAEKRPISRNATSGIYYFKNSADFLAGAEKMIIKNARVNGEFYFCPVFNELILMGKKISHFPIKREKMFSLGTPEDVDTFIQSKAKELVSA